MKWSDGQPATSADACFSWQLGLDAIKANKGESGFLGAGYLDPTLKDAGVTKVDCTDPTKMVVTTDDPSDRVLQVAMPIIPKHVWGKETYKTIADAKFDGPLVGTGPYTVAEWQTGQFIKLVRNPNYWGTQAYQDEVDIVIYKGAPDTMVQALKAGELDYAHGPNADQLNQLKTDPNIATVAGKANGWSQLAFNGYGADTGKTIPKGGPSTKALLDPAFRDALGYAIDKNLLVAARARRLRRRRHDDRAAGPRQVARRADDEAHVRHREGQAAARRGRLQAGCQREAPRQAEQADHPADLLPQLRHQLPEGRGLHQGLVRPARDQRHRSSRSTRRPSARRSCRPRPATATRPTTTSSCGAGAARSTRTGCCRSSSAARSARSSDSQYCNPAYDQMYEDQLKAPTAEARKAILAQMQNLIYDKAVYDILYYDANLEAYRTDRFAGWQNQPID